MILVGLTGGIASGKSTVSSILKNDFKCPVIDADVIARQVVEPGRRAHKRIVQEFGDAILQPDGAIDRAKLGEIIFKDPKQRRILNSISHPEIGKAILWLIIKHFFTGHRFVILDIPLLFESGTWTKLTSLNVVVYCQDQTQLQRLMKRNDLSEEEARRRINSQLSLEEKRNRADIVIENDGSLEETYKQVENFYQNLRNSKKYLIHRLFFMLFLTGFTGLVYKLAFPEYVVIVASIVMSSQAADDTDKVKNYLRSKTIKLWLSPYSDNEGNPNDEALKTIVEEVSKELTLSEEFVSSCINNLREHSVQRLKKKEQNIVTLKLKCSARQSENSSSKGGLENVEVKLDITGDELKSIAAEKFGIADEIKLICGGRVIEGAFSLHSQHIKHNSVILCLILKKTDREESNEVEKALNEVKRARKGAELLADAGAADDDTAGSYDIEIADQKGQVLDIPVEEKRALTIALGLHEKGRTILKRKEYELALLLLLEADKEFEECRSEILSMVDNYAVLCLDIVWCYVCTKNIAALPDARIRLDKCERSFKKTYGESLQRLLAVKGSSGNEISLFVRLYVLQAIVNYHDGNFRECSLLLDKAHGYAKMVVTDEDKVTELMGLGLSARESRMALREFGPCANGDQVNISSFETLVNEMGFEPKLVSEALKMSNNEVSQAIELINTKPDELRQNAEEHGKKKKKKKTSAVEQLKAMGFTEETSRACLEHFSGDAERSAAYLAEMKGVIPPEWWENFVDGRDEPGPSKYTDEEMAMMRDVAQDVSQKNDEYLDVTLEEELNLITQYTTMVASISPH